MKHKSTISSIALYICLLALIVCILGFVSGAILNAKPSSGGRPPDAEVLVFFAGIMFGGLISVIGVVISIVALVKEKRILKGFIALLLNGTIAFPMCMYLISSFAHNRARQEEMIARETRLKIDVEEVAFGVDCNNSTNKDGSFDVGKYGMMSINAIDICLGDLLDKIEELQSNPSYRYEIEVEGPTNYRLTLNYENIGEDTVLRRIAKSLPGWWEVHGQKTRYEETEKGTIATKTEVLKRIARP